MRRFLACAAAVLAALVGGRALACGASFGNNVTVDPHQDIIVVWKDGVETYVFQPTFCGSSTDFGLVLPVSSPLAQPPSLADQQAFTTAVALSEPTKREVAEQNGIGCGGAESGSLGAGGAPDDTPTVVASGRVGFLDWTQLKADTVHALTDWLTANGYPYSQGAADVFGYYVQKGWYFIAFRISQTAAPGGGTICQALGPVALTFPTATPIIPSRMATAGSTATARFSWRIFGITHGDVQLSLQSATSQYAQLWYSGAIPSTDVASFAGLAEAGDRLTRVTLSFYAASGTEDATLTVKPAYDYRGTVNVVIHDDSACSVGHHRIRHGGILSLFGLAMVGLFCWRRWR